MDNKSKYITFFNRKIKEYQKKGIEFPFELLDTSSNDLTIIDILYLYEQLQGKINNTHCLLLKNVQFDVEGKLIYAEKVNYEEIFSPFLPIKDTIADTLIFAKEYVENHKGSESYKLIRAKEFYEVEKDIKKNISKHIEIRNEKDILDFIPEYEKRYQYNWDDLYVKISSLNNKNKYVPMKTYLNELSIKCGYANYLELYKSGKDIHIINLYSQSGTPYTKKEITSIFKQINSVITKELEKEAAS